MWSPLILAAAMSVSGLGDLGRYPGMAKYAHLPKEVRVFIDRRIGCNHFAGEEPYDKERAQQIGRAERGLGCRRLESDERALRRKYADSPPVLRALDDTREDIW